MREILFRGKRVDNGEWVEGTGINTQYDTHGRKHIYIGVWHFSEKEPLMKTIDWYEVIPETVGQYTGLTDNTKWEQLTKEEQSDWLKNHTVKEWNGKKIFEGDIHERENHFFVVKYGKYRDCETNEDGYGWYFEYTHRKGCEGFDGTENEYVNIIGNIHDNPELLEVHNG